jgi:hypothetical protein
MIIHIFYMFRVKTDEPHIVFHQQSASWIGELVGKPPYLEIKVPPELNTH